MSLTLKRIARLLDRPGRHFDTAGLYLQVQPKGEKAPRKSRGSWLLRYERDGRERYMGLGRLSDFSLDEARARAKAARQLLADGIDPIEDRNAKRAERALAAAKALTFEDAAKQYFDQHEKKWRNAKHRAQFLATLRDYAFPKIGKLSVAAIDTGLVLKCLEPIWPTKTETASRVRGRIEAVLDWATVRGYRSGDNPARWKGHLDQVLPAPGSIARVNHHAALPFTELPALMDLLTGRTGTAARALEFTILTAARTSEAIGATWPEIDLKSQVWTVPANRIKGGKEHRVPLSNRAVELLEALPRETDNPHVFIGPSAGAGLVLRRVGHGDVTVHGFRSTFMDWAHEHTAFPKTVIDMALATSSATRSRPRIGAATCSTNGAS
jgi:integrase